jgi:hypothetical protein
MPVCENAHSPHRYLVQTTASCVLFCFFPDSDSLLQWPHIPLIVCSTRQADGAVCLWRTNFCL